MAGIVEAFLNVLVFQRLLLLLAGLILGIILGAIPGIGGVLGMAILLPLTLSLDGLTAVIMLSSIYLGSLYGGAISAVLINVPGTSGAVASTFDGYPLTRQGKAAYALAISAISSSLGGFLSAIFLIILTPYLVEMVLLVQTPEYFLIAVFGLALLPMISSGSQLKGLFAVAFGLEVTAIGVAPMAATTRYTFDIATLYNGVSYVAILIGLFAVTEMVLLTGVDRDTIAEGSTQISNIVNSTRDAGKFVIKHPITLLKSTLIGLGVGAVPGTGASISNLVAYGEAVRSSDDDETFGNGNEIGLIATESSNNATASGSLVPVLSFGIPGGAAAAVILGAMILHGIVPGPRLFTSNMLITQTIFAAVGIGSLVILLIGVAGISRLGHVTTADKDLIIPLVIVFAICGAFSLNAAYVDVFTVMIFGIVGYLFRKFEYPVVALLLGAILGGIIEETLFRSLQLSGGSYDIFLQDPLSILLVLGNVLVLILPQTDYVKSLFNNYVKSG